MKTEQRQTPRTDKELHHNVRANDIWGVSADFARTLERELAEAHERIEDLEASAIHSCHDQCQRPLCKLRREAEELREMLSKVLKYDEASLVELNEMGIGIPEPAIVTEMRALLAKHKGGEDCPNCPNQGWFVGGDGEPQQCQWCHTTPNSKFNKGGEG